jgi:hypothetical protein
MTTGQHLLFYRRCCCCVLNGMLAALLLLPSSLADHETFETTDAGASHTFPQQAGTIRKNGFIVIKGRPCKVRTHEAAASQPGNRPTASMDSHSSAAVTAVHFELVTLAAGHLHSLPQYYIHGTCSLL